MSTVVVSSRLHVMAILNFVYMLGYLYMKHRVGNYQKGLVRCMGWRFEDNKTRCGWSTEQGDLD